MSDEVKFRDEAIDEAFNKNKKDFLAILPLGSNINLLFFLTFIAFSIMSCVFIEIPVKINSFGIIKKNNNDSHITFNQDGYRVKEISKINNSTLLKGETVLILEQNYSRLNKKNIDINLKHLEDLKKIVINTELSHIENKIILNKIHEKQKDITLIIEKEVKTKKLHRKNAVENHRNGLIGNEKLEETLNYLQDAKFKLAQSQQSEIKHLQYILEDNNRNKNYISEINSQIKNTKQQIAEQKQELEPILLVSPCDCTIDRISIKEGDIIEKDELLITLRNNNKTNISGILYISTMNFGDIDKNSKLNIKVDSYPFLKYGTIKGDINYISHSPISESYLKNKNIIGSHYLIETSITNIPDDIKLKDGMSIQAHIVTKTVPLYKFLFEKM
jgi:multidrug resistance efflux pump